MSDNVVTVMFRTPSGDGFTRHTEAKGWEVNHDGCLLLLSTKKWREQTEVLATYSPGSWTFVGLDVGPKQDLRP